MYKLILLFLVFQYVQGDDLHLTADNFKKTMEEKDGLMVMFYAPWCPHCQSAKPTYTKAAEKINKEGKMLAMINCDEAKNTQLCGSEKIEGYPTFKFYSKGKHIQDYDDEPSEKALGDFMANPPKEGEKREAKPAAPSGGDEQEEPDTFMKEVIYLGANNYTDVLNKYEFTLVFYYAPWCPHCKDSKPKYEKAAIEFAKKGIPKRIIAAMNCDAKNNQKICEDNKVEGYPTIRLLKQTETWAEHEEEIEAPNLIKLISNPPKDKVPPTPVDKESEGKEGEEKEGEKKEEAPEEKMKHVTYLQGKDSLDKNLKGVAHSLVMFYAPWCPHCQQAKAPYDAAGEKLKDDKQRVLAAVNCDEKANEKLCEDYKIEGFPTFLHFQKGVKKGDYPEPSITTDAVVKYMNDKTVGKDEL